MTHTKHTDTRCILVSRTTRKVNRCNTTIRLASLQWQNIYHDCKYHIPYYEIIITPVKFAY